MIDEALEFLKDELNSYVNARNGQGNANQKVCLSHVANDNGECAIPNSSIGVSLINIEEERVFKEQKTAFVNDMGMTEHYNPEIKLNLYVLITARYTDSTDGHYAEGLKQLSHVISFFQGKNVFTEANSPGLKPEIQKMVVELFSYSFEQLYNFWSVLGAKYLPSVLYKVRLVTFQEKNIQDTNPVIKGIEIIEK